LTILNQKLLYGGVLTELELPNYWELKNSAIHFEWNFGLKILPLEPGFIVVRGARQYGKSSWLQTQIFNTYTNFGKGCCAYLNGDSILNSEELYEEIKNLISFLNNSEVKRIFIDEITAVEKWEIAIKRLWDEGLSRSTLIITTGSNAVDLLRGSELLPGRKGKIDRNNYIFLPISFSEFCKQAAHSNLTEKFPLVENYLISGGSPIACKNLIEKSLIDPYIFQLTKDWILGAIAKSGRTRLQALAILNEVFLRGCSPVSLTKIARDSSAANNTVVLGYLEIFRENLILHRCFEQDFITQKIQFRKESKIPFVHLLAASAMQKEPFISTKTFELLSSMEQGKWYEWLVAQELWRREMMNSQTADSSLSYLKIGEKELDFFDGKFCYEVKKGKIIPQEFDWFVKKFPKKTLKVISNSSFHYFNVFGYTFEEFLLEKDLLPKEE
jgi:uncharacterized protein